MRPPPPVDNSVDNYLISVDNCADLWIKWRCLWKTRERMWISSTYTVHKSVNNPPAKFHARNSD